MLRSTLKAIIMGPAGGGKGTIAKKLLKEFDFIHVSTGDLLRAHIVSDTALGKQAQEYMNQGSLVPDELVICVLKDKLLKDVDHATLIDGFPRNVKQAQMLSEFFKTDVMINLVIPHQTIMERSANRWIHMASGRTYSYDYNPPKVKGFDDITGEALEQRADDKPDIVKKRLLAHDATTQSLLEYYEPQCKIGNFEGTESDVIFPQIKTYLLKHFSTESNQ